MTAKPGNQPESGQIERSARDPFALVPGADSVATAPGIGRNVSGGQPVVRDPLLMVLAALRQYKWSVLAVTVILSAISVASIWKFVVPVFRASAVARVSPVGTRIVFATEDNGMVPLYKSFLNTQVSIIRGRRVLERVLDNSIVQGTEWYKNTPHPLIGTPPTHLERLLQDLTVTVRAKTELIDVAITARNAADAKLLADTVVNAYKAYSDELITETELVRMETLLQEKGNLEREINGLVATISHMTTQIGAADPVERLSQVSARLAMLDVERDGIDRRLSLIRWELAGLAEDGDDPTDVDATAESVSQIPTQSNGEAKKSRPVDYARDLEWRRLKGAVADAENTLEHGRQRFGRLHPQLAELERTVAHSEKLLQERVVQLDEQAQFLLDAPEEMGVAARSGAVGGALKRQRDRLTQDLALLDATMEKVKAKVTEFGQITKDMSRYDEELRHKRETHDLLRTRVQQLALERKAPARITVAAYSIQPTNPSRDRRVLLTMLAIAGSLALAFGQSYLRLMMDPTVRDRSDVDVPATAPFLGHLPQLTDSHAFFTSWPPSVLEVMRMVRTALLERIETGKSNALLVTSSSPNAGKTSVSILLANSLALLGKRTLLVDADIRHPSIADRLCINARRGLVTVLTGGAAEEDVICSLPSVPFDILPAGKMPEGATPDILANGVMSSAVDRWKQRYDFVIVDSPPACPVADARILGGLCDGTVMVIRTSHCRRAEVREAYDSLAASGCNVLGTVLVGGTPSSRYNNDYYSYIGRSWGQPLIEREGNGNGGHDSGSS